uniref:Uncharacterized protein n=1 Tax=Paramormyrops kingsleyae TaxID=1676925 RepID=A0A3B3QS31_9TELE
MTAHSPATEKLTMVGMKFSRIMMERICFQSVVLSPRRRQMDSRASFTAAGGLAMDRTSTKCCFLMDLTAKPSQQGAVAAYHTQLAYSRALCSWVSPGPSCW